MLIIYWSKADLMHSGPITTSNKRHKHKAFTLVEILVVISIIALLMGILTPVLNKAKVLAYRTVCKSNLYNLSLAFRMYLDGNRDIMPPASMLPSLEDPNDPAYKPPITEFLLPYLSEPKTFKCRADKKGYFQKEGSSYGYNHRLGGKPVSQSRDVQRGEEERNIEVMYDYVPFHGEPGRPGATNYLYADGHIGDLRKQ
ncbi:type II secretion system protein [Planctomycetota bacterium]